MDESRFSRRQVVAGAGGMLMGQLTGMRSAAAFDWQPVSLREAGFAGDLTARLDKAIADKRIWNSSQRRHRAQRKTGVRALLRG